MEELDLIITASTIAAEIIISSCVIARSIERYIYLKKFLKEYDKYTR